MEKVRAFATSLSFFLMGDLPILLSPDSADVWKERSFFRLDLSAGAPPDLYNTFGQKWGFPLLNWDVVRKDHFSWWKRRLSVIEKCYHMYRIDHVVGFFRIWAIPEGKEPTDGYFIPTDASLWFKQGQEILEMMIDSSPLLPIAEDLGTIPEEVYPILKNLGICGIKVLRWQGGIAYSEYEPLSMTTVSTADMEPLSLWWEKYPNEAQDLCKFKNWDYEESLSQSRRMEILQDAHSTTSLFHINPLQEYLALFPELVWDNPLDERINIPGTLLPINWTYRLRPYLEELTQHTPLSEAIEKILMNRPLS
jgi:4-alpha-glucanotransferase